MSDSPRAPVVRNREDGRTIAVVGDVYRFLAIGEETDGKYAIWEAIVPPGGGPPPHVHSREEEGFYVLEGEIRLQIGERRLVVTAGMFANMPVGTPHSFKNESGTPARMLISIAPAGLEKMFFEVGVPVAQGATTAAPPTKAEIEKMLVVAERYGIEIKLQGTVAHTARLRVLMPLLTRHFGEERRSLATAGSPPPPPGFAACIW